MRSAIIATLLVCLTSACASGTGGISGVLPDPGSSTVAPLRPGDRVAVKVWSDSAVSDTFVVSTSGDLALPKIGIFRAASMGAGALQDTVRRAYTALVQDPAIQIAALRRVGVVGEVRAPGIYFSDLTMTIGDIIALAGGVTENGNPNRITIRRGGEAFPLDLHSGGEVVDGIRSGDQIVVGRRNFWARNPGLIVSSVSGLLYFIISRIN